MNQVIDCKRIVDREEKMNIKVENKYGSEKVNYDVENFKEIQVEGNKNICESEVMENKRPKCIILAPVKLNL